jgi:hypothetical protein
MRVKFTEKLAAFQRQKASDLGLLIAPKIEQMPLPMQRYDDPFLPFGKAIINATKEVICAYIFDLSSYLALGAAGAIALERTIDYVGEDAITILHGAFAIPSFASVMDETAFGVDAATIADGQYLNIYTQREDCAAFVISKQQINTTLQNAGNYLIEDHLLMMHGTEKMLQIRVAGETVLFAGRGEDFAEVVRKTLEQMRHG